MIATKLFDDLDLGETRSWRDKLHRWLDPNVGRWISEDPIGFAAGDANVYRYVYNAPPIVRDPSGLQGMQYTLDDDLFAEALAGLGGVGGGNGSAGGGGGGSLFDVPPDPSDIDFDPYVGEEDDDGDRLPNPFKFCTPNTTLEIEPGIGLITGKGDKIEVNVEIRTPLGNNPN